MQFFSDSIIINFSKSMHFSIISDLAFSSFIRLLHFSSSFSIYLFLYIWKIILIATEMTFSSLIWKIIFHNLSKPVKPSIFSTSIISYSISLLLSSSFFIFNFIFSLFISKNKALNNFNCSAVISEFLFSEINSNNSSLIFSFLIIVSAFILSLLDIYFLTKS